MRRKAEKRCSADNGHGHHCVYVVGHCENGRERERERERGGERERERDENKYLRQGLF